MKSPITTHILDTARGCPASGVEVELAYDIGDIGDIGESRFEVLGRGVTDNDGRVASLLDADTVLRPGVYRLSFAVEAYLESHGERGFYPGVDVRFRVEDPGQHYHVPLLLSPFGYSTYRGS